MERHNIPVIEQGLSKYGLSRVQFLFCPAGGSSQPQSGEQLHIQTAVTAAEQVPASHEDQIPDHIILTHYLLSNVLKH